MAKERDAKEHNERRRVVAGSSGPGDPAYDREPVASDGDLPPDAERSLGEIDRMVEEHERRQESQ